MTGVSVINFKRGDEPMKAKNKRIMITIPPDLAAEIQSLKKEKFYDKPYAEMYRQIIRTGLECVQKDKSS